MLFDHFCTNLDLWPLVSIKIGPITFLDQSINQSFGPQKYAPCNIFGPKKRSKAIRSLVQGSLVICRRPRGQMFLLRSLNHSISISLMELIENSFLIITTHHPLTFCPKWAKFVAHQKIWGMLKVFTYREVYEAPRGLSPKFLGLLVIGPLNPNILPKFHRKSQISVRLIPELFPGCQISWSSTNW